MRGRGFQQSELESLYRARYAEFVRVAAGVTGDIELARDAVQEAFAAAWRKRRPFRGEGPLEAWIWRIVVNAARMQARTPATEPLLALGAPSSNGSVDEDAMSRARNGFGDLECGAWVVARLDYEGAIVIDLEPFVRERLARRVPAVDAADADWLDVRRRAGARERRRRLVVATVGAVAAAALIVTPALGVGDRLLDFFGLAAPPSVKKAIDESQGPDPRVVDWLDNEGVDIDKDTIRGIVALDMPNGRVQLWGAEARDGELRVRFVQMPGSGKPTGIFTGLITGPAGARLDTGAVTAYDYPVLSQPIVHGQVNPPVVSARVRYEDDTTQRVPIVDGYFLAALERSSGWLTIEALDGTGEVVATESANLDPPPQAPPPREAETRELMSLPLPRAVARLLVRPSPNPGRCYRIVVAAHDGSRSGTGSCPGLTGELDYGFQQVGNAPNATVLLVGAARLTIIKVRIKVGEEWLPVPLKEHYFLVALRPDQRPSIIETTSRLGAVKDRQIHLSG